jgi:hypothetical protein
MIMMRLTTIVVSVALFVGGCATTTTRTHPTLEEELHRVNSVVIVPPRIEIQYVTLTGEDERMIEEEQAIRTELMAIAARELRDHGYEVIDFDFQAAMDQNDELAYTVTEIREGFDRARADLKMGIALSKDEANEIRVSVGEAVNTVAAMSGADAILLMRYVGFKKSGGYVAKDVGTGLLVGVLTLGTVVPVSPTSGAMTEVALIDAVSGDVLWADITSGMLDSSITDEVLDTLPHDIDPTNGSTQTDN